ncbi:MAG: NADH-quinone oxidoreductase subunit NuoB [Deltaproteobacteria bacterium]|nr:NADH-quinone oxidoreductase subunit NuoB [Deltaproteobacteria bacterium]
MGQLKVIEGGGEVAVTTRLSDLLQWARKWSLFQYPFVTACCGMEFMATAAPRYDIARFGAEAPRFSPRQSDVLWVVGTISQRQGPAVRRIWEQMADPKWVIAFGTCDKVIPVDVYIPGCPPRPEAVLDALMLLQDKIQANDRKPIVVPPRLVPERAPGRTGEGNS